MKVKYKGHKKKGVPVWLPIGVQRLGGVKKKLWADPYVELSDEDAKALVELDSQNFELAEQPKEEKKEKPKKKGRPKKEK